LLLALQTAGYAICKRIPARKIPGTRRPEWVGTREVKVVSQA
jgi:hypothetical protein